MTHGLLYIVGHACPSIRTTFFFQKIENVFAYKAMTLYRGNRVRINKHIVGVAGVSNKYRYLYLFLSGKSDD